MNPAKKDAGNYDQGEASRSSKKYRIELGVKHIFVMAIMSVLFLSWMFAFGVLVGRGVPQVSSKDISLRADFLRFLGLGKEIPPPPENVAETWENPKKMLESLNYYEDLSQKAPAAAPPKPSASASGAPQKGPPNEASGQKANEPANPKEKPGEPTAPKGRDASTQKGNEYAGLKPHDPSGVKGVEPSEQKAGDIPGPKGGDLSGQKAGNLSNPKGSEPSSPKPKAGAAEPGKAAPRPAAPKHRDPAPSDAPGEHFTLLIASLKDTEKAQHLVEELKTKGYAARIEPLDLNDSGHWNRVLVSSFRNREEATRFAAELNRKERLEGLVIREAH